MLNHFEGQGEVRLLAAKDLKPNPDNPRIHRPEQVDQVAASIKEFGFTNPILIDEENVVLAGHGRLLAAGQLKLKKVPCIVLTGLTPEQRQAYTIADNKLTENSDWDVAALSKQIEEIIASDMVDLDALGFNEAEFANLTNEGAEFKVSEHWRGMPEFEQEDETPYRQIIVSFKDAEAVEDFARIMKQGLTEKTKSIWHPFEEWSDSASKEYA